MLEFATHSPGSVRASDITDYYSQEFAFNKDLELWNGKTKLPDDRLVGKMKSLLLKPAVPAHQQLASPGKEHHVPPFLTPREAYDLGMRSQPAWHGKLPHITQYS